MARSERGAGDVVDPEVHQRWLARLAADKYAGWRALLAKEPGTPIFPNEPFTGFYRSRKQDKTFVPVAIWYDEIGSLCYLEAGKLVGEAMALERWQYVAKHPISHEWYKAVQDRGEQWPDGDAAVSSEALAPGEDDDNKPLKPIEQIKRDIEIAAKSVPNYAEIDSEEKFAQAQAVRSRLLELHRKSEEKREALKRPHLNANKLIDEEWMPVSKSAKLWADTINDAQTAFREAERKAERDRIAEAAKKAAEQPEVGNEQHPATPPEQPSIPTAVKGAYGRAAGTKFKATVTGINDVDALFAFMRGAPVVTVPGGPLTYPKLHPDLREFMIKLAQRALDANLAPPGVIIEEKAKVS